MSLDVLQSPPKRSGSMRRAAARFGRPPKALAGEVDERILDAARAAFLERGFEGASIEEIAAAARSGKRTIYRRFRDKSELFAAVIKRDVISRITQFEGEPPIEGAIEERLARVAIAVLHWNLLSDKIGLMRLAIAEAQRFPDLASTVSKATRAVSTEVGARVLREMSRSSELGALPAFAPERLLTTARFFLDVVAVPLLLRALFEVDLKALDAEIGPHVTRSVGYFLAACRQGGAT